MHIRPFAAVRPNAGDAALVAAVPYDVVDTAEAKALASGNPKSFLHVSRPEIDLAPGTDCSSPEAYAQAKKALDALVSNGTLLRDPEPKFYAYRQTMGSHSQTGIVATFDTQDYLAGILKQHEKTRKDKEDDRTRHIETLQAHTGPAFLTYRDDRAIDEIVRAACREAPLYDFVAPDGIGHTVWEIGAASSCMADELVELFARIPVAYIADGHHRSAAASRYAKERNFEGESRWFMAVIFPASQLKILAYNRYVADLNGLSDDQFLAKVAENFKIGEKGERNCRMYFRGKWTDLSWSIPADADVVSKLDVSYLQDRLLAPVLGIGDPRTDARIAFMGGIRGDAELQSKVDSGEAAVAFAMEPVSVEEMMSIADAGAIMPPKSTWFEPKLRSGLFVHTV
ncbi:MAG: DUF1015 domain-containing protein [Lentisphaerae bacterium]|jgi:uncharacterized protein (DUF1015 family)|nr:DUF1015 domain-containing protein [Lentisphaerota bacterium]